MICLIITVRDILAHYISNNNQCHGTDQYWNPNNLASTTTVHRLVLEENCKVEFNQPCVGFIP